jgi:hypothetical protein
VVAARASQQRITMKCFSRPSITLSAPQTAPPQSSRHDSLGRATTLQNKTQSQKQNRVPHPAPLSRVGGFVASRAPQQRITMKSFSRPSITLSAPQIAPPQSSRHDSLCGATTLQNKTQCQKQNRVPHPAPLSRVGGLVAARASQQRIAMSKTKPGAPSCVPQQGGRFCSSSSVPTTHHHEKFFSPKHHSERPANRPTTIITPRFTL